MRKCSNLHLWFGALGGYSNFLRHEDLPNFHVPEAFRDRTRCDNHFALNLSNSEYNLSQFKKPFSSIQPGRDDDLVKLYKNQSLGYGNQLGSELLRRHCNLYSNITPSQINVVAPAEGIFLLIMNALLQPALHQQTSQSNWIQLLPRPT